MVNVTENAMPLTLITTAIEARDPDTTADLKFEILWTSSYATKGGREADKSTFMECFVIQTVKTTRNVVYAHLKINENFQDQVDYEKYDTIFLTVKVTDEYQEINDDSSTGTTGIIF